MKFFSFHQTMCKTREVKIPRRFAFLSTGVKWKSKGWIIVLAKAHKRLGVSFPINYRHLLGVYNFAIRINLPFPWNLIISSEHDPLENKLEWFRAGKDRKKVSSSFGFNSLSQIITRRFACPDSVRIFHRHASNISLACCWTTLKRTKWRKRATDNRVQDPNLELTFSTRFSPSDFSPSRLFVLQLRCGVYNQRDEMWRGEPGSLATLCLFC